MSTSKLSAGDIIEARCTRCRDILNHRIVAMVDGKVVKVECNTCGGTHNYYPPPTAKQQRAAKADPAVKKTAAAPRSSRKDPSQSDRDEWASLRPNMMLDKAKPYSMTTKFRVNELLDHPTFGYGIVKTLIAPNKMQVLFEDGIKLLRCL